jgi:hypothetical protein
MFCPPVGVAYLTMIYIHSLLEKIKKVDKVDKVDSSTSHGHNFNFERWTRVRQGGLAHKPRGFPCVSIFAQLKLCP